MLSYEELGERLSLPLAAVGYGLFLALANFGHDPWSWRAAAGVVCIASTLLWHRAYRRARAIADTPTSRIASAHQGCIEVRGHARALPGTPLLTPFSLLPCVWYRGRLERRSDNKWELVSEGCSGQSFLIQDGSGQLLVDPEGAEVSTDDVRRSLRGDERWTEWVIVPGASVYALGMFATLGGQRTQVDEKADLNAQLSRWKREQDELLARFDLDGNGEIDAGEWTLARQAALREVRTAHEALRNQPPVNMMRKPDDGSPFLVSARDPDALATRHGRWAMLHFAVAASTLVLVVTTFFAS